MKYLYIYGYGYLEMPTNQQVFIWKDCNGVVWIYVTGFKLKESVKYGQ